MGVNFDIEYEIYRADQIIDNTMILLTDCYLMGYQSTLFEYTNVISLVTIAKEYLKYSTKEVIDDPRVANAIYIIREFLRYKDIKSIVSFSSPNCIKCFGETNINQITPVGHNPNEKPINTNTVITLPPTIPKSAEIMDFKEYILTVDTVNQTVFYNLPFYIDNIDVQYLSMTVGGDNPNYTKTGVGYHMVGNTLYWHGEYNLRPNYKIVIKYVNLTNN